MLKAGLSGVIVVFKEDVMFSVGQIFIDVTVVVVRGFFK